MAQLDDIVKEFLVESYESLDQLDQALLALEESPEDRDRLASIFRTVHTIKGTSGFLAFPKLEHVTHVGESLLVPLRDGDMGFSNEIADGLLSMLDAVRSILANIESTGYEGDGDYEEVVRQLETLRSGSVGGGSNSVEARPPDAQAEHSDESVGGGSDGPRDVTSSSATSAAAALAGGTRADEPTDSLTEGGTAAAQGAADTASVAAPSEARRNSQPTAASSGERRGNSSEQRETNRAVADRTVRIDVELLDKLMNLVGELVLARNQILQFSRNREDTAMTAASQRLNLITSELQEGVMKTRMQPIRNAWNKLPRVVRDLSNSCGKRVRVCMEGADTELDKTILEAIKDPLTHVVRNAVDHGIESPAEREAAGKPVEGTLWLRAFHEGGQVNIEIGDDGGGISLERVKQKAISKGMVSAEQADKMNDRELCNLILLPGFSTAAKVTNVSGRGVGMDVVKTNVEKIGGTLDIQSVSGRGTTLRIKIPLTLAIVPALVVTCRGDRYAIPQVSLLELVRLEGERAKREIELIHSVPCYRLRGRLLPLLYLDEQLRLRDRRTPHDFHEDEIINIVVLQAEDRQFGLVVDQINDTQEIVVKPLGQQLKGIPTYAGATIMGDGSVSLILDVNGLASQGNVLVEHQDRSMSDAGWMSSDRSDDRSQWLLIDPGDGGRAAISLASVSRLEE
ncbi:MAG: chemotaxis protein CheA, partial [Planctomycetales bacterium]|nr:chemotaxis protein CheA [Planctomycetales bacterium]